MPRITLETEEGRPVTNKTDFNGTLPGTFILPPLEFSTETSLEAWELHAEYPGPIELHVRHRFRPLFRGFLMRSTNQGQPGGVAIHHCTFRVSRARRFFWSPSNVNYKLGQVALGTRMPLYTNNLANIPTCSYIFFNVS